MARLGDICTVKSGYAFKSEDFLDNGVPIIRIGNITSDGLSLDDAVCFGEDFWEKNPSYRVNQNDILIAMSGATVGKCCLNKSAEKMLLNQRVAVITCGQGINFKYIYHIINSNYFIDYVLQNSAGCAQPNISAKQLMNFEIKTTEKEVQDSISNILDKVDELITLRKEQLAKLDQLIKSRFIELFGDPETNPKGFEKVLLSDIAEYFNGLTYSPDSVTNDGTVVLRSSNIQNSQLDFADTVKVSGSIKEKLFVKNNDILMCSRNGSARLVGKVALIKNLSEPMTFGAFMMIIRSKYYPYLMTYFQMDAFRRQISTGATTTINQITGNMLNKISLPLPKMADINEFATFVEQTDKSKLAIQQSLDKLELLKKSLMQEYFG